MFSKTILSFVQLTYSSSIVFIIRCDNQTISLFHIEQYQARYPIIFQPSQLFLCSTISPQLGFRPCRNNPVGCNIGVSMLNEVNVDGVGSLTTNESLKMLKKYGRLEESFRKSFESSENDDYYNYRAEFEIDSFAEFNAIEEDFCDYWNLENYQEFSVFNDYLGQPPLKSEFVTFLSREQTFLERHWDNHLDNIGIFIVDLALAGKYNILNMKETAAIFIERYTRNMYSIYNYET